MRKSLQNATFTVFVMLFGQPIAAQELPASLTCIFDSECFLSEQCEDTVFEMELTLFEAAKAPLVTMVSGTFSTVAETRDVNGFWKDGIFSVSGGSVFPSSNMITGAVGERALYTHHADRDYAITYVGVCK